jgi:hypothetical protein
MSKSSDATAREIIDRASQNQEVTSLYAGLSLEEQKAVYSSLWKQTVIGNQAPGLEITGLDTNGDGLADKLKSVVNKADGTELYQGSAKESQQKPELSESHVTSGLKPMQIMSNAEYQAKAYQSVEHARSDLWQPIARQFGDRDSKEIWKGVLELEQSAKSENRPEQERTALYQELTRLMQGEDPAFSQLSQQEQKSRLLNRLEAAGTSNLPSIEHARSDLWQPIARQYGDGDSKEIWSHLQNFEALAKKQHWSKEEQALFLEKLSKQADGSDQTLAKMTAEQKKEALSHSLDSGRLSDGKIGKEQEKSENSEQTKKKAVSDKAKEEPTEKAKLEDRPQETREQLVKSYTEERQHLLEQAKKTMNATAYQEFTQNLEKFEKRARPMSDSLIKQGFAENVAKDKTIAEFRDTYKEISRLLETPVNFKESPVTGQERVKMAGEIMSNAADPTAIYQGQHNTCNVTTIETRTYTRTPSQAAKLVTDVALSGEYKAQDGTKVRLDQGSLRPDHEAWLEKPVDGKRTFASQLFQVTAVNLYYQKHNPNIHYEQGKPDASAIPPTNGERLVDYSKNPPEPMAYGAFEKWWDKKDNADFQQPNLYDSQILEIGNSITGETDTDWYIGNKQHSNISNTVDSPQALQAALLEAKHQGKLPVIVKVNTNNEPFYTDSGRGAAGGSGGWHVVTVTDIQEGTPPKIQIDNQWNKADDHLRENTVSIHDLYRATQSPEAALITLRKEVAEARKAGNTDFSSEFQLLSLEKRYGGMQQNQYEEQLVTRLSEYSKKYMETLESGTTDVELSNNLYRSQSKANELLWSLSPAKLTETLEKQGQTGFYSASDYDRFLASAIYKTKQVHRADTGDGPNANTGEAVKRLSKLMNALPPERQASIRKDLQEKYNADKKAK